MQILGMENTPWLEQSVTEGKEFGKFWRIRVSVWVKEEKYRRTCIFTSEHYENISTQLFWRHSEQDNACRLAQISQIFAWILIK